eukprot:scaffold6.g2823.t1
MATIWRVVAYYCLPVPLILFFLLSLPLPRNIRRGILILTQRVFDLPLIGVFKLLHVMLFLTLAAFLGSWRQVVFMRQLHETSVFATPNQEIGALSKRWRAERNLWMSAFAFSAWIMLGSFYREAVRRLQLQERFEELEKAAEASDLTATTATEARAPGETGAGSKEVNSRPAGAERGGRAPAAASPAAPNRSGAEPAPLHDVLKTPLSPEVQMTDIKKEL